MQGLVSYIPPPRPPLVDCLAPPPFPYVLPTSRPPSGLAPNSSLTQAARLGLPLISRSSQHLFLSLLLVSARLVPVPLFFLPPYILCLHLHFAWILPSPHPGVARPLGPLLVTSWSSSSDCKLEVVTVLVDRRVRVFSPRRPCLPTAVCTTFLVGPRRCRLRVAPLFPLHTAPPLLSQSV